MLRRAADRRRYGSSSSRRPRRRKVFRDGRGSPCQGSPAYPSKDTERSSFSITAPVSSSRETLSLACSRPGLLRISLQSFSTLTQWFGRQPVNTDKVSVVVDTFSVTRPLQTSLVVCDKNSLVVRFL